MTKKQFRFEPLGIWDRQSFPGCSAMFTEFSDVFVGIGDSQRQAADDAVEQYANTYDVSEQTLHAMERDILTLLNDTYSVDETERLCFVEWIQHDGKNVPGSNDEVWDEFRDQMEGRDLEYVALYTLP